MGNLDQRYSAYSAQIRDWYYVEGRPYDRLSRIRDTTILEFHAFGSAEMQRDLAHISPQLYWQDLIKWQPFFARSQALKNCILTKGLVQECTTIAVREKLIPSFEEYTAEIDLFLAHGARFKCAENPRD